MKTYLVVLLFLLISSISTIVGKDYSKASQNQNSEYLSSNSIIFSNCVFLTKSQLKDHIELDVLESFTSDFLFTQEFSYSLYRSLSFSLYRALSSNIQARPPPQIS